MFLILPIVATTTCWIILKDSKNNKGGKQILVKEVECEDYAQDDSKNGKDSNRAK